MDWEHHLIPVDEDEGSCPQGRVNRIDARNRRSVTNRLPA